MRRRNVDGREDVAGSSGIKKHDDSDKDNNDVGDNTDNVDGNISDADTEFFDFDNDDYGDIGGND